MTEHHGARLEELDLAHEELGEAALDRLPIDVAAPCRGQDGDVGTQPAEQARPVAGGVLFR